MGRHARRSKTVQYTSVAAAGAVLAGTAIGASPAVAQAAPVPDHPPRAPVDTAAPFAVKARPAVVHQATVASYTVRPGDNLSAIAQAKCGSAAKWPRLWGANFKVVGSNPNLIRPGQLLKLACNAAARLLSQPVAVDPSAGSGPDSDDGATPAVTVTGGNGVIGYDALRAIQNLVIERVDEGQDLGGTGPLYPVAGGTIESTTANGWPGSAFILEKLDAPIDGYGYVYYAEDITPAVSPGEHVTSDTVLGDAYDGGSGMELGWGTAVPGEAAAYGHYVEGQPTPEGESFSAFLLGQRNQPAAAQPAPTSGPVSSSAIPAWATCIVARESGGNPQAQNPASSASGLFQDLASTWNGYDGYPTAASAPESVQVAFNDLLSDNGANLSPWAADGCPGT